MLRRALLILAVAMGFPAPAQADVFRVGDFVIQPDVDPGSFELSASVPSVLASDKRLGLPQGCRETSREKLTEAVMTRYAIGIACDRVLAAEDAIVTPWAVDGGTFLSTATGARVQQALQPDGDTLSLPIGETVARSRALPEVAVEYTWQGIVHILGGWDHLAFVLCLCLLARGRFLLALVTTFTLGHSLSLALAFFDIVKVPVPPVEAVIALSIAFMAREAIRAKESDRDDPGKRRRQLAVVAGFGLLHGLGFATVLRELGVAPQERLPGLLFFNGGVELGQLIFVACVLGVMKLASIFDRDQWVRQGALYGAGIVGCFWVIERVAGFTLGTA
ncbi:HupE/UreJ family protein [Sphingobium sp. BYY-5]|uniref:HupE/UreJ family protein n=1 Tax=Sphingobium sp. BYY-5 TaxID=2926400 RepID=UPI001FA79CF1|nr:HupE/UreJ family protein [Sphingobium sp. BYY-5]MCI4588717.1 HupE/UreJ family protein [Sphingobium sp. BYY-5]